MTVKSDKTIENNLQRPYAQRRDPIIHLIDQDELALRKYSQRLRRAGFLSVQALNRIDFQLYTTPNTPVDLVIVDLAMCNDTLDCYGFAEFIRFRGFNGNIVLLTEQASNDIAFAAIRSGISDIWIKGPFLKIQDEVHFSMQRNNGIRGLSMNREHIETLGIFRSAGLTKSEIFLLKEWASGFPRQCIIAEQMGITTAYVNKLFSRIYEKLKIPMGIDNPAQLAHFVTICAMF